MSKKRGAYRSRKLQTKKRDDERRRESAIYNEDQKPGWVSIKGKQRDPAPPTRRLYIKTEDIDPETEEELGNALSGESNRYDKYAAARMIVAVAMAKGIIRE
jgi:hypothetical protein